MWIGVTAASYRLLSVLLIPAMLFQSLAVATGLLARGRRFIPYRTPRRVYRRGFPVGNRRHSESSPAVARERGVLGLPGVEDDEAIGVANVYTLK